jgi:hypothetical protein
MLLAMTTFLLQTACTIGLTPLLTAEASAPTHSGCHDSAPSAPESPNSGQKCCSGKHAPEALLNAVSIPTLFVSAELPSSMFFSPHVLSRHVVALVTPSSGPPDLFVFRI